MDKNPIKPAQSHQGEFQAGFPPHQSENAVNPLSKRTHDSIADPVQAKENPGESASRFRAIFDQSSAGSVIVDLEKRFVRCNPAFRRFLGYKESELIGKTISDVTFPEDRDIGMKELQEIVKGKRESFVAEKRYLRKDGRIVWGEVTISLVRDADNNPLHFLPVIIDITARKQMEQAFKESEQRFRDLFEEAPLGYQSLDNDGRFIEVNRAWLEVLGYKREEVIGRWFGDFLAPEYIQAFRERFPVFKAEGKIHSEFYMLHRDGSRRFIAFDGRIGHNVDGSFRQTHCILKDESERKLAEDKLRSSEAIKDKLISNIGDVIVIIDQDGINKYKSPNVTRLFGWKPEEVTGKSTWDNVHPDDLEAGRKFFGKILAEPNAVGTTELRYKRKDGNYAWIEISVANLLHDKDIHGVLGNYHDVTQRKLAAEALQLTRFSMEAASDALFWLTPDARIVDVNAAACRSLGYTREELLKMTVPDIDPHCNPGNPLQRFAELRKVGSMIFESEHRTKDGRLFPVEIADNYIKFGSEERSCAFVRDITERKMIETYREIGQEILQILTEPGDLSESVRRVLAALKARTGADAVGLRLQEGDDYPYIAQNGFSREFLLTENSLVERGRDGGVCRDKDGNICLECTCGLVISGRTDSASPFFTKAGSFWINDSLPLLDLPADQDPRLHPRNSCIHQGYASVALIPVRNRDRIVGLLQLNDKRKGRFTLETIEILEGIAAHIGSALLRKQAQEELRKANEELQQAMQELQQAQKHIIQQERLSALGQMASGIAHDFNNILQPIIGFSELLISDPDAMNDREDARHMLEMIHSAGQDARNIVRRLRTVYNVNYSSKFDIINIASIVESALSITMPKWKEEMRAKGTIIEIVTDFQPVAGIKGNASELREIMTNLIFNAVDAMPKGGIIKCSLYPDDGSFIILEVKDNGEGMDEATLDRCMEPFFSTKGPQGSGLGLAMVHGIVERHGGTISIESKPGAGTKVQIRFPVPSDAKVNEQASQPATAPLSPMHILVVDDEARSINLLTRILKGDGHQVEAADNGRQGLNKLRKSQFDMIITDRAMPVMGGDKFAAEAQKIQPGIPIIMLTGFGEIMKDSGVLPPGVSRVMSKPLTKKDLRSVMSIIMSKASGA